MAATLNDVTKQKQVEQSAEQQAATELVRLAREQGLSLTEPGGLLKQLTKTVLANVLLLRPTHRRLARLAPDDLWSHAPFDGVDSNR